MYSQPVPDVDTHAYNRFELMVLKIKMYSGKHSAGHTYRSALPNAHFMLTECIASTIFTEK